MVTTYFDSANAMASVTANLVVFFAYFVLLVIELIKGGDWVSPEAEYLSAMGNSPANAESDQGKKYVVSGDNSDSVKIGEKKIETDPKNQLEIKEPENLEHKNDEKNFDKKEELKQDELKQEELKQDELKKDDLQEIK